MTEGMGFEDKVKNGICNKEKGRNTVGSKRGKKETKTRRERKYKERTRKRKD